MRLDELDPGQVTRVAALLDEAMDLPDDRRADWCAALTGREPQLSAVVAELLRRVAATDDRRETGELIANAIARAAGEPTTLAGRRIGPYRVLSPLGQGGMGSVWLAERADGLFARKVALKLLHASLVNAAMGERFMRERAILAGLDHPHIARLLDAGIAEDGQPYIALEHVEGIALDTYCEAQRLGLDTRIDLLLQVLSAVQYAHQALVIHRDLKPANILVTAQGQVRLLDFGIAKLMTGGHADETELTRLGGRALTLDYASPEQVTGAPMSTASDVYALGVVLYGLLCGHRPYAPKRNSRAALEEAILSVEPRRPSQQPSTVAIAAARATTPRKLAAALAGDLDTIVLKTLKKNPAERYPTAAALLQDLMRYRQSEPVAARPDSASYRVRKFIGRHRLRVALGTGIGLLLVTATTVSVWQAERARTQARMAQLEAQRAQAVQRFLLDIFMANSDQQADPLRARQTTARELLDLGARKVSESLASAPQTQIEMLDTLADMYVQLGLAEDGARMRRQRVDVVVRAHGADDVRVAEAWIGYARDIAQGRQRGEAPAAMAEAKRILDAAGDYTSEIRAWYWLQSAEFAQYLDLAAMRADADRALEHFRVQPAGWALFHALQAAARARHFAGDHAGALALHAQALAEAERRMPGPSAWHVSPWVHMAEAKVGLLDLAGAEQHYRDALALTLKLNGPTSGVTLQTQAKLGGFLQATGRRAEGLALLEDAYSAIGRKGTNATPPAVAAIDRQLGAALVADGRLADGEQRLAAEIADLRLRYPGSLPLSRALLLHASALTAMGRLDASGAELDEAWRLWQRFAGAAIDPALGYRYRFEQGRLRLARGDAAGAMAALDGIVTTAHVEHPAAQLDAAQAAVLRARALAQQRRFTDAQSAAADALRNVERSPLRERLPLLEAEAAWALGQAQRQGGDAAGARVHLERAVTLRVAHGVPESAWLAEARIALAECLVDLGDRKAAQELLAEAKASHAAHAELGEHFKAPLAKVAARLEAETGSTMVRARP